MRASVLFGKEPPKTLQEDFPKTIEDPFCFFAPRYKGKGLMSRFEERTLDTPKILV